MTRLRQMGYINAKLINTREIEDFADWQIPFHSRWDHIVDENNQKPFNPVLRRDTLVLIIEKAKLPQAWYQMRKLDTYLKVYIDSKSHCIGVSPVVWKTLEPTYGYRLMVTNMRFYSKIIIDVMESRKFLKDATIGQVIINADRGIYLNGFTLRHNFKERDNKHYLDVNLRYT